MRPLLGSMSRHWSKWTVLIPPRWFPPYRYPAKTFSVSCPLAVLQAACLLCVNFSCVGYESRCMAALIRRCHACREVHSRRGREGPAPAVPLPLGPLLAKPARKRLPHPVACPGCLEVRLHDSLDARPWASVWPDTALLTQLKYCT